MTATKGAVSRLQNISAGHGCTPCSPARARQSGLFFRRRHRAESQAPDYSQSYLADCGQRAYHFARLAVSKRIHAGRHVSSSRDLGRRQDELGRSTRHHAVLQAHEHGRAGRRGIMVDGRGEVYLGILRLGCFRRVAAGKMGSWVPLLMYMG